MLRMENRHWEIVRQILGKYPYQFYAYGSRVKKKTKKYSDLDICFQKEIPWNVLSHIEEDFEDSDLPFKIDLVSWKWMNPEFRELIRRDLTPINLTSP